MTHLDLDDPATDKPQHRGLLAWFAQNPVAANLVMVGLLVGGIFAARGVEREVYPEFDLDLITVAIAYPGASPEEVEQGVVLAVEEAVRGVEGVKELTSTASEGAASVSIELLLGTDRDRALADVKSAVDRIGSLPQDAERPVVSLFSPKRGVLSLIVHGDVDERSLRTLAERTRDGLLDDPGITLAELSGVRPYEISIEVPQLNLRRYGLTLDQVADAVRSAAVELPAGGVKTAKGEVLVRLSERRELGLEFEDIVVLGRPDGTRVLLGDIATIRDGFSETDQEAFFNGRPAARIDVYRVGEEGPVEVSAAVRAYIAAHESELPPGVQFAVWDDRSEMYSQRIEMLENNAIQGLFLVIAVLGLLLEIRLAFWVTMGIPVSIIGSMIFLPMVGVSLNMVSLFAFIITLGIVVDDAIIIGEAVFTHQRNGRSLHEAAILGVREVAMPVVFAVMTTIIAFMPLMFVPGWSGKFFRSIPLVVMIVIGVSLCETLFSLPSHLSEKKHLLTTVLAAPFKAVDWMFRPLLGRSLIELLIAQQGRVVSGVEWFAQHIYGGALRVATSWRYLTLATALAFLIGTVGWVAGGRIQFTFMPKIDGDVVSATLVMPVGTPVEVTRRHQKRMMETAEAILQEAGGAQQISRGMFAEIGGSGGWGGGGTVARGSGAGHKADVRLFMVPIDARPISTSEFARRWRDRLGPVVGAESLEFEYSMGSNAASIAVRLSHPDPATLEHAAEQLALAVGGYAGAYDVDDGIARGKEQLDLVLRPEARSLGIDQRDLARQVRSAFFGAEVLRQQRGRNELRVYVRRPRDERSSEQDIEDFVVRTPGGGEIPLGQAASLQRGRAYTTIARSDGRRTLDVKADVDPTRGNGEEILAGLRRDVLPKLMAATPGLSFSFEGRGRERVEMMDSLGKGFKVALLCMYCLLAVAFRSYVHPLIVLLAIPFGIVGAILGHVLLGYDMSIMTVFGLVALSGVVVNESLVMVDAVNRYRDEGLPIGEAVMAAGTRRFRPILLTSLTTTLGLVPSLTASSVQAKFLVPLAISLGFGVQFAAFLSMFLVPCVYLIVDDLYALRGRLGRALGGQTAAGAEAE
jgi:multidrug efflux pump subunit AcrB